MDKAALQPVSRTAGNPTQSHRCALISGGTSGIGRAIALALSDAGCRVMVTGRTSAEAEGFAAANRALVAMPLDVTDEMAIRQLIGRLDRLDILVNCAGTILRGGREHDPADFAKVIDVNLHGTMRMSAAC